jgi:hypothetical protein
MLGNKTENAFSPLPESTKASNADLTVCLALQDCIVHTTRLPKISAAALQLARLPAYGQITLHGRCPAVLAVSQTAYKHSAVTCSGRIPNFMLAAAVALLQWQDIKLRAWLPCCSVRFSNCIIE